MPAYVGAIDQGTTSTRFIVFDATARIVSVGAARARADLSRARPCRARPAGDLAQHAGRDRRGARGERACAVRTSPRSASPTSARRRCSGTGAPASRCTTPSSGRTRGSTRSSRASPATAARTACAERPACRSRAISPASSCAGSSTTCRARARRRRPATRCSARSTPGSSGTSPAGPAGGLHITDVTNASRTQLMDLATLAWDDEILDAVRHPARRACRRSGRRARSMARPTEPLAGVPIAGILGDQQAALVGQACFRAGRGQEHLRHRLLHADEHRRDALSRRPAAS